MKNRIRQDAILRCLRRGGSSTIAILMKEARASRSTIIRDLSALRDEGYVIVTEQGRGGGLYLDPGSVQRSARLTVAEVFALIISVASMRAAAMLPFAGLADAGLAKIEKALSPGDLSDLRRLLERLYVGPLAPAVDISNVQDITPALLPAFEQAFLGQKPLRFAYTDAKGAQRNRQVEPQALLILPPLWYLVAWDPMREDFRHFRMDRIAHPAIIEGTRFRPRRVTFDEGIERVRYA